MSRLQLIEGEKKEARRRVLNQTLKGLVRKDPTKEGFFVEELVEVYRANEDGRKSLSVGFFRDENLAKAFVQNQADANWHKTDKIIALTNGDAVFQLKIEDAPLFEDDKIRLEIYEKPLAKLTPEQRHFLNLL